MNDRRWRVLIADDHPVFRSGLRAIIESAGDMDVSGEAANGLEAVAQAIEHCPDVILMDLHMPEMSGVDATRKISVQQPEARVLILTMLERDDAVFAAMRAGARGYVVKGSDRAEVLRAIRAVAAGDAIMSSSIADRLPALLANEPPAARSFPDLTERERQILQQLAQGMTNAEIAAELVISLKTVRNHVSNIFTKLEVTGRAQAIAKARDAGIDGWSQERQ